MLGCIGKLAQPRGTVLRKSASKLRVGRPAARGSITAPRARECKSQHRRRDPGPASENNAVAGAARALLGEFCDAWVVLWPTHNGVAKGDIAHCTSAPLGCRRRHPVCGFPRGPHPGR
jgi:hypothetical protein